MIDGIGAGWGGGGCLEAGIQQSRVVIPLDGLFPPRTQTR